MLPLVTAVEARCCTCRLWLARLADEKKKVLHRETSGERCKQTSSMALDQQVLVNLIGNALSS